LETGEVKNVEIEKKKGVFEAEPCSKCGKFTFVDKLIDGKEGNYALVVPKEIKVGLQHNWYQYLCGCYKSYTSFNFTGIKNG
jgi:hypothetical protein